MFWVTLVSGVAYVVWLIVVGQRSTVEVVFRGFQFVTMLLVLSFPVFVRRRLKRDLVIDLGSSLLVAVYVFIRHDKVLARYQTTNSGNGYRLQVTGFRFQVTGYRLQVTGFRFQVSGYRLQVSGFRFQVTGYRLEPF